MVPFAVSIVTFSEVEFTVIFSTLKSPDDVGGRVYLMFSLHFQKDTKEIMLPSEQGYFIDTLSMLPLAEEIVNFNSRCSRSAGPKRDIFQGCNICSYSRSDRH